jgi:hypothetical protein
MIQQVSIMIPDSSPQSIVKVIRILERSQGNLKYVQRYLKTKGI